MKKPKSFRLSVLFVVLALAILLFDGFLNFAIYFGVVCLHELAHFLMAKKLGYKLANYYVMPYGVCLNYNTNIFAPKDEVLIALAGPLSNIAFCILCVALWWLFPSTYYVLDYFCFCNLILAGFNLLPCFPLDGGRVLTAILSKKIDRERAIKVTYVLNYIFSAVLIILFVISIFTCINFSYIFVAIFLFSGTINSNKYSNYEHISLIINKNKLLEKGADIKAFAVNSNVKIFKILSKFSKYKYNVVYVVFPSGAVKILSENNINNLAIKYSPTKSLEEITNKLINN
ncbi:MAG: hypothetical protein E7378_01220 [Clostridiales bacterium]|nr:hypothetical protein [Clostridiales bacterium]